MSMKMIKNRGMNISIRVLVASVFVVLGWNFSVSAGNLEFTSRSSKLVAGNPFFLATGTINVSNTVITGGHVRGWEYDSIIKNEKTVGGYGTSASTWLTGGTNYTESTAFSDLILASSNWVNANGMQVRTTSNWVNANGMLVRTTSNAVHYTSGPRTAPNWDSVRSHRRNKSSNAVVPAKLKGAELGTLLVAHDVVLDGKGGVIQFDALNTANGAISLIEVMAGKTLTFTNVQLKDFTDDTVVLHPGASVVFGDQTFIECADVCSTLNAMLGIENTGNITIEEHFLVDVVSNGSLRAAPGILNYEKTM